MATIQAQGQVARSLNLDEMDQDGFKALGVAISNGEWDIAKEMCEKMNIDSS